METATDLQRSEFYQGRGLINLMKAFGGPGGEPTQLADTGSSSHVAPRVPTVVRPSTDAIRESEELENSAAAPVRLMCSYSHKDEQLWEELKEHLSPLQRQGLLKVWYDRAIEPGSEWEDQIFKELAEAEIIILLVSASFTASDFCFRNELTAAIERHKAGQCRVIPVIARDVDWKKLSFGRLQALPKDGKPVTSYTRQDEAWLQVAQGIRLIIEKFDRDRKLPEIDRPRVPARAECFHRAKHVAGAGSAMPETRSDEVCHFPRQGRLQRDGVDLPTGPDAKQTTAETYLFS